MELFVVDTGNFIIYVYKDNELVRIIDNVWIGKNGVTNFENAIEGDGKTPLGLYDLGISFGIYDLKIKYPYIKINENSYWVDDAESKYYNYFVQIDEDVKTYDYSYIVSHTEKEFKSAEHLIDFKKQYEYAIFIEFNSNGQIDKNGKGNNKGSAIFLHCHGDKGYTGGCIAINRKDMLWILKYLDINKHPKILII